MIGVWFLSDAKPGPNEDRYWQPVTRNRETDRVYHVPRSCNQWSQLTDAAEQLLANRREKDPASIAKGRMTKDTARDRERIMAAVVAIWRDAERMAELRDPMDWPHAYGASWIEIQTDLRAVAKGAVAQAAKPGGDPATAGNAIALAWHFEPITDGGPPHIGIAADHVRHMNRRDRRAA